MKSSSGQQATHDAASYGSADEFIAYLLEKELAKLDEAKGQGVDTDPAVLERLRGLVYIE